MKSVAAHGLMALLALVAALYTWNRPEDETEAPPGEATMIECEAEQFASLTMRRKNRTVVVVPQEHNGQRSYWITDTTVRKRSRPPEKREAKPEPSADNEGKDSAGAGAERGGEAQDKGKTDGESKGKDDPKAENGAKAGGENTGTGKAEPKAEPDVIGETRTARFLARADFEKYMGWILPVRALRRLGNIEKERLREFQLDEVDTTMELVCGGETHTVEVGGRTYGKGDQYAKKAGNSTVYLVPAALVRDLSAAKSKFMQRDLHDFGLDEVDEARIEVQGTTRKLLHRNRQDAKNAMWVDAAAPERRNRLFGNWFGEVSRLKASAYLEDGAEPGSELEAEAEAGQLEPVLSMEYLQAGKSLGKMEMVRVTAGDAHYYARTPTTQGWVTVPASVGSRVARDVAMVVGLEESESESRPKAQAETGDG